MAFEYGPGPPHAHVLVAQPDEPASAEGMTVYRCECGDRQERATSWDGAVKLTSKGAFPVAPKIVWWSGDKMPYYQGREAGLND